jgi:hypothetical protein
VPKPMLLHPLAPEVKCPGCGSALAFIRVRRYGACTSVPPVRASAGFMHYRNHATKTCGWALLYTHASLGIWVACGVPAAEKE